MIQEMEMTYQEKYDLYMSLEKESLVKMLIEANRHLSSRPLTWKNEGFCPDKIPYNQICSCNPLNGGSGVCGCTMANEMVTTTPFKTEYVTEITYNSVKK